ncbi:MAG: hypothetical protein HOV77_04285 [Hamadaea sp.]|uniref:hypothetical protein n=1 Tax=Hamadaea sp. TaxID=2024425 RepID=UPI001830C023|nr:hypothetical protein [Hamadaea sp.]NUT18380.1 hypothetical protein [Hamadaea sp.]
MYRRIAYAAAALLVGLVTLVVAPTPASAAPTPENDHAVAATVDDVIYCWSIAGAKACYEYDGDKWWVQDTASDGMSAVADWRNYLTANGDLYRQGKCINSLGYGDWGVCNKNYYETSKLIMRVCVIDYSDGGSVCSGWVTVQAGIIEA